MAGRARKMTLDMSARASDCGDTATAMGTGGSVRDFASKFGAKADAAAAPGRPSAIAQSGNRMSSFRGPQVEKLLEAELEVTIPGTGKAKAKPYYCILNGVPSMAGKGVLELYGKSGTIRKKFNVKGSLPDFKLKLDQDCVSVAVTKDAKGNDVIQVMHVKKGPYSFTTSDASLDLEDWAVRIESQLPAPKQDWSHPGNAASATAAAEATVDDPGFEGKGFALDPQGSVRLKSVVRGNPLFHDETPDAPAPKVPVLESVEDVTRNTVVGADHSAASPPTAAAQEPEPEPKPEPEPVPAAAEASHRSRSSSVQKMSRPVSRPRAAAAVTAAATAVPVARESTPAAGSVGPEIPAGASAAVQEMKTFMDSAMDVILGPEAGYSGDLAKLAAVIMAPGDAGAASSFSAYAKGLDSVHAILLRVLLLRWLPTAEAAELVKAATRP